MRTLQDLARESIEVQDACNLTAVARAFSRAIDSLREIMPTLDTMGVRRHPIVVMWAEKISDLTGINGDTAGEKFCKAYEWCKEHANDEKTVRLGGGDGLISVPRSVPSDEDTQDFPGK